MENWDARSDAYERFYNLRCGAFAIDTPGAMHSITICEYRNVADREAALERARCVSPP